MYYPDELIEEVRQRNDIVDVVSTYVKLQKRGGTYFGLCPFHNEKSPSFSVTPGKQMYYCFGCGAGGNVFTFLMEYENYTFAEAVKTLAQRAGVSLPQQEETPEQKQVRSKRQVLLDINKLAAKYFHYQLGGPQGRQAKAYFDRRMLDRNTIVKFGLGYANKESNDLYKYLRAQGYQDDILKDSGLISLDERWGGHDKFWNRVMFPIMDVNNRVIGFGGRVMDEGTPKYLNSPETLLFDKSRNLYGLNLARISRKPNIIICEGYMDVIAMHQAGFNNAVASLGTALTSPQGMLLKRYTQEVLLSYDSDGAGQKAALRAIPILKDAGLTVKVIDLKPYKDPDEFIKAKGTEAFQERIQKAQNSFMFEISVLEKSYDFSDPEAKTKFFNEVARRMLKFPQELERHNYIEALARQYSISYEDLKRLVNTLGSRIGYGDEKGYVKPKPIGGSRPVKAEGHLTAQKFLLTWLVEDTSLFSKIEPYIDETDFDTPLFNKVAVMLFEEYRQTKKVTPARIINQFDDKEEQKEVASIFNTNLKVDPDKAAREKALNDTVQKIKRHSIETASKNVQDIKSLQQLVQARAQLQKLHISL